MNENKLTLDDIESAYEFVSMREILSSSAYVSKTTGKIFYLSDGIDDNEEGIPEDIYEDEDYLCIPDKYELDLGKELVWEFVDQEIPALQNKVRGFFNRSGAYSRYKAFLEELGIVQKWYDFEENRTKKALLNWCKENELNIS